MENNNEYLYHYTNIETLALILKNHTIRLNNLSNMDDLQECKARDLDNAGRFVFVSSWTEDEQENIPMWKMYASLEQGIRIKLKKNPFKQYTITEDELKSLFSHSASIPGGNALLTNIPFKDLIDYKVCTPQIIAPQNFLTKIEYTEDENKIYPNIVELNESNFSVKIGSLGKYKNLYWSFQNEWRYILTFFPLDLTKNPDEVLHDFQVYANLVRYDFKIEIFDYYDLYIDDQYFEQMEITFSPKMSLGNQIIVESLIEKYNPKAVFKKSCLTGLIK